MFKPVIVSLAISLLATVVSAQQPAPPDVPASIKAPVGDKVVLQAHAAGAQVYTCSAAADGKFAWTLKGPEAELRDENGRTVIIHSAGPTWQHKDGSQVTGKVVAKENAPDANSVPWLLLSAATNSGEGVLSRVTSIQRIHTEGGQPPATGCDAEHSGAQAKSNYSADYVFYAPAH